MATATVLASVFKGLVLDRALPPTPDLIFHAIFAVTLFIGALTSSELYHKSLIVFGGALFVLYIILLYARMQ